MKKSLSLLLCTVMVMMLLVGCGSNNKNAEPSKAPSTEPQKEESEKPDASKDGVKIGVTVADQSNVFYVDIIDGMKKAMKAEDELVIMDAGFDAAKQLSDIEDMLQQGVQVMLIDPVDSEAIKAGIDACNKAKIPVIAYNSPIAEKITSTVASDNYMAGQLVGEAMAKALDGKGDVAMLTYNVAEVCLDRANGFMDAIKKYPDIKIVDSQEIQPGVDTALPVAENILQSYPKLSGFFALNDPSALGCAAAVESANLLDKVKIVGVDGSDDGKKAISEGKMLASAAQHPLDIGQIAVETAYKVLNGETVEENIKVPVELVDSSNVDK